MTAPSDPPSRNDAQGSRQPPDGNGLSRTLRIVGFGLLALPVVLMALVPSQILRVDALGFDTVLLGEWVPSLVAPVSLCFWGGLLCSAMAPLIGVWGRGRWSRRAMRVLSPIIMGSTTLLSATATVGLLLDQDQAVLEGTSPAGCRVVIATNFAGLDAVDVSVGVVQPGTMKCTGSCCRTPRIREQRLACASHGTGRTDR